MASNERKRITEDIHGFLKGMRPEQALQEALRYVRSILGTMRDPLVVLDDKLRVISANQSFYEIFLVRPEDTEGRLIYELDDGYWDIPRLRELLEEILPRNTSFNDFEIDHDFPGIGRRAMLLNARRIYSEGNKTQRILLGIEDITERKNMEQEVAVSEVRYRRLFETAQDGILILDAEVAQIEDVNPFLVDMLGFSRQEFLGKKLWEIGPVKDIEASQIAFKALQESEYIRYEDLPLETRGGKQIQVEFVSNVYPVNGRKVIQCNIRDVTERKKIEKLKDEFIGMVSHELSNPLTIIMGCLNTVLDEATDLSEQERSHLLKNAAKEADVLSQLLGNLLELSRAQAERLFLHAEPIEIGVVASNVIERITEHYPTCKYSLDFPTGISPVDADPLRLERILFNLLDNACKYSPKGSEVKVFAKSGDENLIIGVSDQGVGIPVSEHKKIFGAFERLEPAISGKAKGTGIGLLVCQRLVEAHGGRIWVESAPGKGSTFFFSLPFKRET
ncbi:ATP-binding protein [Chloroflexota bacterium]